ncbi:hypothetical protein H5201_07760 [Pseudoalteromonas sp. SG43-6]|nr:hypothetical protein [Pseudoalteromonas sp. SG43-6]MBB1467459.1 hypothetical protein [Pseudoalteromonas sp. SG41-5]
MSQCFLVDCLADNSAPLKQLTINSSHNKVPFSECNALQQHTSATKAQTMAPNQ